MNLFFVYDTAFCKADEDDPKDAVVYFFPVQASESQRYFLSCQLAGVAKFLKTTFSAPSVVGLDQGKFAFLWSGNYLLVLGGNSEVPTSTLQDQLTFLCGIFCFYHGSINNVLKECKTNREDFLVKMELAWSRYITLSQCFGNVLQLSLNALPLKTYRKQSSGVIAAANRLLHTCQFSSSVVAGAVFYNSRVLSTQFMPQLTNYLSLLSNYNASAPVSNALHKIRKLPPEVELKYVYLSPKLISNILKFNHTCVGSRIRVKTEYETRSKSFSAFPFKETVSSGSEGDIDSGNCSESIRSQRGGVVLSSMTKKSRHLTCFDACKKKRRCNTTACCASHSRLFERMLLASKNRCLEAVIDDASSNLKEIKGCEMKDSGNHLQLNSTTLDFKRESTCGGGNFLCSSHAYLWASSFVTESNLQHTNLTSSSDLEFWCFLCTNYNNSTYINELSLKKWNSEVSLSDSVHTVCICSFLASRSSCNSHCSTSSNCSTRTVEKKISSTKFQILRCRSNSDNPFCKSKQSSVLNRNRRHISEGDPKWNGASSRSPRSSIASSISFCDKDKCLNIESNDLQKYVLYVQRYGGSTLVLLLNKGYDEKVITYLWNCGFTILRELECSQEKQESGSPYNIEPSFYILLYNHVQKILKEHPHFPSLLLTEKHSREIIQMIQEDFKTDSQFQVMCLLSSNHSIFASHKDQNLAFYLQPESNSRKVDPLLNLNVKAARRLGKYFKIVL